MSKENKDKADAAEASSKQTKNYLGPALQYRFVIDIQGLYQRETSIRR